MKRSRALIESYTVSKCRLLGGLPGSWSRALVGRYPWRHRERARSL